MASFATDSDNAERGPTRSDTFETLVEPEGLGASSSPAPAASNSTPNGDKTTSPEALPETPKKPDWTKAPKFYDVTRYAEGLPRLAVQQTQVHNGSIHRRFEPEGELLISHWEYRTAFAAERLWQWYTKHPEAGKRLSAGQRKVTVEACEKDEHDILIEELEHAWYRCHRLKMAQKEERTLLGVHRQEVRGLYGRFLASQGMTDEDVFLPAYAPDDDFCTTALHQGHLPIRNLLNSRFGAWVQKKLPFLKLNEDSGGYLLSMTALTRVLDVFQVFSSSSLLLVPMGVLLFGGLDKLAMFGVVVASVFVISAVVVLGRGVGMGESGGSGHGNGLLLGVVAAYTAVLASFLAQLGT